MKRRINWGQEYKTLPPFDLLEVQKESYHWFLEEGIAGGLKEVSPIQDFTGKNWELSFGQYHFGKPRCTPQEAIKKGVTFDCPLKVQAILVNKKTGRSSNKEVFFRRYSLNDRKRNLYY